ncbi:MAG: hypothetical protein KAT79_07745, partial [candidate division Zixibacteria bacterium]|nr:hypothetical protein [candidate division Zixibacteria bacterium]
DLILLDSPPVIPVSDPMLLSPKVDGLLLVLRAGSTQKEVARRALDILDSASCRIVGVVLNDMNQALPFYYDYNYYGYQYNQKPTKAKDRDASRNRSAGKRDSKKKTDAQKKI